MKLFDVSDYVCACETCSLVDVYYAGTNAKLVWIPIREDLVVWIPIRHFGLRPSCLGWKECPDSKALSVGNAMDIYYVVHLDVASCWPSCLHWKGCLDSKLFDFYSVILY